MRYGIDEPPGKVFPVPWGQPWLGQMIPWSISLLSQRYLIGGLEHVLFSIIYGIILPIDYSNIFQDG